ncbi:hypothetical protein [Stenotrophomonas rhizophila]|uniref:hypothetical protein n=1 Tax=Stenotrophomonas rhizophila TaxID=216778 RepID=UPI0020D0C6B3|nr:hypothetical protein [Stenotrophomonas rhizophila]
MPQPTSQPLHTRVDSRAAGQRWPLLGTASWLVAPVILAVAQASPEMGRLLVGSAGVAVGVLASSVLGLLLTIGSRVRRERWPWVGIVGAIISALPLLLFLAGMLLRL